MLVQAPSTEMAALLRLSEAEPHTKLCVAGSVHVQKQRCREKAAPSDAISGTSPRFCTDDVRLEARLLPQM